MDLDPEPPPEPDIEVPAGPDLAATDAVGEPADELDVGDPASTAGSVPSTVVALVALATVVVTAIFGLTYQDDVSQALISTSPPTIAVAAPIEGVAPTAPSRRSSTTRPPRSTTTRRATTSTEPPGSTSSTVVSAPGNATTSSLPVLPSSTTFVPNVPPTFITSTTASSTTSQPPVTAPAAVTVTVSNRATAGMGMQERPPLSLGTVPGTPCVLVPGCQAVPGTAFRTGDAIVAVCQADRRSAAFGYTSNGDDSSAADDANPELVKSWRWYGIRFNQTVGYVSEVWIAPSQRGGLGLTACIV